MPCGQGLGAKGSRGIGLDSGGRPSKPERGNGLGRGRAYDVTFACWSAYPFGGFLAVLLLPAVAWYRAGRPRPA